MFVKEKALINELLKMFVNTSLYQHQQQHPMMDGHMVAERLGHQTPMRKVPRSDPTTHPMGQSPVESVP